MSLTVDLDTYERDTERSPNHVRYTGPNADLSTKDQVDLKRTPPKPTATYAGQARSSFKLTRTMTDGTDPVGDGLIEISTSFPVGSATAEQAAMIDDAAAFAATAQADDLFSKQDINQ